MAEDIGGIMSRLCTIFFEVVGGWSLEEAEKSLEKEEKERDLVLEFGSSCNAGTVVVVEASTY